MTSEARKKLLSKAKLSYADYGRQFRPVVSKQTIHQALSGTKVSDRVCRSFARRFARKPVEKVFPEFYN